MSCAFETTSLNKSGLHSMFRYFFQFSFPTVSSLHSSERLYSNLAPACALLCVLVCVWVSWVHDLKVHVVSVGCFTRFPTFLCSGELIEQQITTQITTISFHFYLKRVYWLLLCLTSLLLKRVFLGCGAHVIWLMVESFALNHRISVEFRSRHSCGIVIVAWLYVSH